MSNHKKPLPRLLIVEDDGFLARLYASYFEENFEVITEPEGQQGLYRMKNGHVDIALIDIMMPKKTGFDILQERQNDPMLQRIPVIVITSLEQDSDRQQAIDLGANDYFCKTTMELTDLQQKISDLLS